MAKADSVSAVPVSSESTPFQLQRASFDPTFEVDVVENLVYDSATSALFRMEQPLQDSGWVSAVISGGIEIQETIPTSTRQNNPDYDLAYDGSDQLINISATIGGTTYKKNLTWAAGNLTEISNWHT